MKHTAPPRHSDPPATNAHDSHHHAPDTLSGNENMTQPHFIEYCMPLLLIGLLVLLSLGVLHSVEDADSSRVFGAQQDAFSEEALLDRHGLHEKRADRNSWLCPASCEQWQQPVTWSASTAP